MKTDLDRIKEVCESNGFDFARTPNSEIMVSCEYGTSERDFMEFSMVCDEKISLLEFQEKIDNKVRVGNLLIADQEFLDNGSRSMLGELRDKLSDLSLALSEEMEQSHDKKKSRSEMER